MLLEGKIPFSYPEPFLRTVRRGALAKSISGYHKNMVRKQYPVLELSNQMPVRIWIWPEPLAAPRVRRALGTRMGKIHATIKIHQIHLVLHVHNEPDYTRKNLTSSSKSTNKLSTSCVRTACHKLSTSLEEAVNNL